MARLKSEPPSPTSTEAPHQSIENTSFGEFLEIYAIFSREFLRDFEERGKVASSSSQHGILLRSSSRVDPNFDRLGKRASPEGTIGDPSASPFDRD